MLQKHLIVICCVAWALLTGYFDFRTGSDVSMLLLYAAPVLIAARYCGRLEGLVVAATAGVCWLLGNYVHLKSGASVPLLSWNAVNRLGVFALIAYAIALQAQLKRALQREQLRATTDRLTGLLNKGAFRDRVEEEIRRAQRYQHPLTLAFIDLDNFKLVNDTQGHARGDTLLQHVSQTLLTAIRKTDSAGRIGGDEFAICYPEIDEEQARQAIGKLLQALEIMTSQSGWQVTASVGVITSRSGNVRYDEILGRSDQLMYVAKQKGKNRAEFAML